ncbi:MAG: mercury(II) reductase [Candidatus Omnitrophica bacterium]|nr:mercury(II) reductase [Candidatus Omnitrophota bacterium]
MTHACCPTKVEDVNPALKGGVKDSRFDLIVVGGGSAAFAAAIKADELNARSAVIEQDTIGGTCLNRGCVPSKYFIRAAELYHLMKQPPMPGLSAKGVRLDWKSLMAKKAQLLEDGRKAKYWDILEAHPKITYLHEQAEFVSDTELRVNGTILKAPKFVIATGSSAFIPPIEGLTQVKYLTSTEALELKALPKSMLVIGANAIGLELAQMFAHLGVGVTIHEVAGRIAPYEEPEISEALAKYLTEEGLTICTCTKVLKARQDGKQITVTAQMPDGKTQEFVAEALLIATGRRPNTQGFGLERAGVTLTRRGGGIQVDDEMKTSSPNIWAAGDCVDCACPSQFVYVAATQGATAAQNAIDDCCHRKVNYSVIPHAIFTTPEVAGVGLTEEQAQAQGLKVKTSVLEFRWVPRAWLSLDERGLIKMVAEEDTGRILGVHLVAAHGGELIHEATLAIKHRLTIQDLIDTLHVYPTLSEALRICAQGFFKDATKLSCCAE